MQHCAKPIDVGYLHELTSNLSYFGYACYQGRKVARGPWPFVELDNFVFVSLQLAEDFQRVLLDAYTS